MAKPVSAECTTEPVDAMTGLSRGSLPLPLVFVGGGGRLRGGLPVMTPGSGILGGDQSGFEGPAPLAELSGRVALDLDAARALARSVWYSSSSSSDQPSPREKSRGTDDMLWPLLTSTGMGVSASDAAIARSKSAWSASSSFLARLASNRDFLMASLTSWSSSISGPAVEVLLLWALGNSSSRVCLTAPA